MEVQNIQFFSVFQSQSKRIQSLAHCICIFLSECYIFLFLLSFCKTNGPLDGILDEQAITRTEH